MSQRLAEYTNLSFTTVSRVACMLPGSHVVSEPKTTKASRDPCGGKCLRKVISGCLTDTPETYAKPDRAISSAFCRDGSPDGVNLRLFDSALT